MTVEVVLVAFYLVLAVKWDWVRRAGWYLCGVGALVLGMLMGMCPWLARTWFGPFFGHLMMIVAFVGGLAACCGWEAAAVRRASDEIEGVLRSVFPSGPKQSPAAPPKQEPPSGTP